MITLLSIRPAITVEFCLLLVSLERPTTAEKLEAIYDDAGHFVDVRPVGKSLISKEENHSTRIIARWKFEDIGRDNDKTPAESRRLRALLLTNPRMVSEPLLFARPMKSLDRLSSRTVLPRVSKRVHTVVRPRIASMFYTVNDSHKRKLEEETAVERNSDVAENTLTAMHPVHSISGYHPPRNESPAELGDPIWGPRYRLDDLEKAATEEAKEEDYDDNLHGRNHNQASGKTSKTDEKLLSNRIVLPKNDISNTNFMESRRSEAVDSFRSPTVQLRTIAMPNNANQTAADMRIFSRPQSTGSTEQKNRRKILRPHMLSSLTGVPLQAGEKETPIYSQEHAEEEENSLETNHRGYIIRTEETKSEDNREGAQMPIMTQKISPSSDAQIGSNNEFTGVQFAELKSQQQTGNNAYPRRSASPSVIFIQTANGSIGHEEKLNLENRIYHKENSEISPLSYYAQEIADEEPPFSHESMLNTDLAFEAMQIPPTTDDRSRTSQQTNETIQDRPTKNASESTLIVNRVEIINGSETASHLGSSRTKNDLNLDPNDNGEATISSQQQKGKVKTQDSGEQSSRNCGNHDSSVGSRFSSSGDFSDTLGPPITSCSQSTTYAPNPAETASFLTPAAVSMETPYSTNTETTSDSEIMNPSADSHVPDFFISDLSNISKSSDFVERPNVDLDKQEKNFQKSVTNEALSATDSSGVPCKQEKPEIRHASSSRTENDTKPVSIKKFTDKRYANRSGFSSKKQSRNIAYATDNSIGTSMPKSSTEKQTSVYRSKGSNLNEIDKSGQNQIPFRNSGKGKAVNSRKRIIDSTVQKNAASFVHSGRSDSSHNNERFPVPGCFISERGFLCCNETLMRIMEEAQLFVISRNFSQCNLHIMAQTVQKRAEEKFGLPFEVIAASSDFASLSRFRGNLVCKDRIGKQYILAYATPEKYSIGGAPTAPVADLQNYIRQKS